MKHKIFSVFDTAAGAFITPFQMPTLAMAKRTFQQCALDENHQFCKNPEDYTLFELGEFEDKTAKYELCKTPISHGLAIEYQYTPEKADLKEVV